jgi:hypothetical protein
MRRILDEACRQYNSGIEQAEFRPSCLYVQVLVPVAAVIEESVVLLNRGKEAFSQDYLVTNASVPTEEEIQVFLGGLRRK